MKITKIKLRMLAIIFFIAFKTFSQTVAPTTLEEYNYLTKGYKTMIESGLDMKKGYSFKEIGTYSTNSRNCTFKALYRDKETKTCGYLCIFKRLDGGLCYICIPTSDASIDLWDKTLNEINYCFDNSGAAKQFVIFLMRLIGDLSK